MQLINSERFQQEYQRYQNKIDKIDNTEVKQQAVLLLKTLVNEVKKLDNQHHDMFSGNRIPMGLADSRNDIGSVRKKLDTLLKDCNQ